MFGSSHCLLGVPLHLPDSHPLLLCDLGLPVNLLHQTHGVFFFNLWFVTNLGYLMDSTYRSLCWFKVLIEGIQSRKYIYFLCFLIKLKPSSRKKSWYPVKFFTFIKSFGYLDDISMSITSDRTLTRVTNDLPIAKSKTPFNTHCIWCLSHLHLISELLSLADVLLFPQFSFYLFN